MTRELIWLQKRIVITGGSSGLGRALALEAARQGAKVVIVARGAGPLSELKARDGVFTIQADVSNQDDIYRITGEALAHLGGIDLLINNASYLGETPLRTLLDTECEDLTAVLETNLIGPFRLTKAFLPSMLLHGGGTVVNISSDASVSPYPGWGSYGASKAALDHLTRIWQEELSREEVRFYSIDPGDMDTPMHKAALPNADPSELRNPDDVARELLEFLRVKEQGIPVRLGAGEWRKLI